MGILIDIIIPWIATCTLIGIGGIAAFWFGATMDNKRTKYISKEEKESLK